MGTLLISHDPDDAGPIGVLPRRGVDIMWVGTDKGGRLVYHREVPGTYETPTREVKDGNGSMRWFRQEVKVERANGYIRPGDHLVVAVHPYSGGQADVAPFKRPCKKGDPERVRPHEGTISSLTLARHWAEHQDYDLWEKGNRLTAGLSEPRPSELDGRRESSRRLLVFGACNASDELELQLHLDPAINRLLEMTEANTIRFWYDRDEPRDHRLYSGVQAMAPRLMDLAIRLSLAGPHVDSQTWLGRPVTEKVEDIYKSLLNLHNRRA